VLLGQIYLAGVRNTQVNGQLPDKKESDVGVLADQFQNDFLGYEHDGRQFKGAGRGIVVAVGKDGSIGKVTDWLQDANNLVATTHPFFIDFDFALYQAHHMAGPVSLVMQYFIFLELLNEVVRTEEFLLIGGQQTPNLTELFQFPGIDGCLLFDHMML